MFEGQYKAHAAEQEERLRRKAERGGQADGQGQKAKGLCRAV